MPEEALRYHNKIDGLGAFCSSNMHFCHTAPDYETVLKQGLTGVRTLVDREIGELDLSNSMDLNRYHFYRAANRTLDAVIGFAERYSALAGQMAHKETDAQRKAELEKIAETCRHVPANPARSFYEALQSIWFIYIACMIEGWGAGIAFARADQYLYPF